MAIGDGVTGDGDEANNRAVRGGTGAVATRMGPRRSPVVGWRCGVTDDVGAIVMEKIGLERPLEKFAKGLVPPTRSLRIVVVMEIRQKERERGLTVEL
ncbi:hypothetical protein COCNU_14G010310 [Cocos nucifera]|uniref:Uncharacterized protein n=1 Tax=Cocos nucifera TaxID=13894 RepID=A0A8K0NCR2_COCNU|nr:hypothetical protein COCNU_14G010310 [Cocos nucifera]